MYPLFVLVLALDTSTRGGSVALLRDGILLSWLGGDATRTHGQRLPAEILTLLERCAVELSDIDLYGVAAGPGSFTGLRVGIATIQGLAFAHGRRVLPVSSLEALAYSAATDADPGQMVCAWMDAHRREVFAQPFGHEAGTLTELSPPSVATADETLDAWAAWHQMQALFVGDAALAARATIESTWTAARFIDPVPPLAPAIGRLAALCADRAVPPHAVRPLYVRRPDAELARDRRRADASGAVPRRR